MNANEMHPALREHPAFVEIDDRRKERADIMREFQENLAKAQAKYAHARERYDEQVRRCIERGEEVTIPEPTPPPMVRDPLITQRFMGTHHDEQKRLREMERDALAMHAEELRERLSVIEGDLLDAARPHIEALRGLVRGAALVANSARLIDHATGYRGRAPKPPESVAALCAALEQGSGLLGATPRDGLGAA